MVRILRNVALVSLLSLGIYPLIYYICIEHLFMAKHHAPCQSY